MNMRNAWGVIYNEETSKKIFIYIHKRRKVKKGKKKKSTPTLQDIKEKRKLKRN